MKIGLVSHYMPPHVGGVEQIAQTLFSGYRRRGFEVRWIASRAPRNAARREDSRIRVPCVNLIEDLLGIPVPLWGFSGWAEVTRLAAWADALHVLECLYVSNLWAVNAARRQGKPVLLLQNVGFIHYRLPLFNWIEQATYATLGRAVLRRASHLVLATPAAEAYIDSLLGSRPHNASTFPIGIDTERFRPASVAERQVARQHLGLPADAKVVLFVGRLIEKKGLPLVIAASRLLPRIHFVVLGDGPLRNLLRDRPQNVSWRKFVSAEHMNEQYHAADCLVLPSHGEGLPLAVQEAMASGVSVVVPEDEPYAMHLVEAGVCVGTARTIEALVSVLTEVLEGRDPSLGERARAFADAHWRADAMVVRCIGLLEQLVAASRPG